MITHIDNGYIISVQKEGDEDTRYDSFVEFCQGKPEDREGYVTRLTESLEWVFVETEQE